MNEKTERIIMWVLIFVTIFLAYMSYYGNITPFLPAVTALIAMILLEITNMKHDALTHGNNALGRSFMDGMAIVLMIVSLLMCFTNVWMDLLWIVIVVGGGYLIAHALVHPSPSNASTIGSAH